jgi:predicted alpha/beta-hydrolase family hydrolase
MQASIMATALAGLAAACWRALREEEGYARSRRPGPSRPTSGLVDATAAAENVKAVQ